MNSTMHNKKSNKLLLNTPSEQCSGLQSQQIECIDIAMPLNHKIS